ncbi:DUF1127 domain-containing protein [Stagnihabitans tardus]|uniref:DUF1127 domain-containing protein n=1 Tax=Stagnihabitans tardus TaxID=2699202 RepID=A0AAE4Y9W0_9RHOB|nr:DUF1127 domain-containing protein [Stagnihabitans tardus]NBZ88666.1 DUF1127 domain-containing protein [Stagnihabitans tardus]
MELALSLPRRRRPWSGLVRALTLHRSRRGLAALDDHMLRDIGLTRAEAEAEAERPLWDAPGHWQAR